MKTSISNQDTAEGTTNMKMISFLALVLLAATTSATTFTECEDVEPPTDLRVNGCDKEPCGFKQGGDILAEVDFIANHLIRKMKPEVKATVLGMTVDFPVPEQDACKTLLNAECPLEKGDKVTYNLQIPVLQSYPKVPVTVRFSLKDTDNGQATVCFKLEGKVV